MIFSRPIPFSEAIAELKKKQFLPTDAGSAELEKLDAALKRYFFFMSRQMSVPTLQHASDFITRIVDPQAGGGAPGTYMDSARFVEEMQKFLGSIGYSPEPGKEGTIQDLRTDARLKRFADMNVAKMGNLGQALQRNDRNSLDAFPCNELYRAGNFYSKMQRNWPAKWRDAGGRFYGFGRMIAAVDDPIWTRTLDEGGFNRFGDPYGPFDYNSGMRTKPVSLEESVELGVIDASYQAKPLDLQLTPGSFSLAGISKSLQAALVESMQGKARVVDGQLEVV
jgi:hypothetical protein